MATKSTGRDKRKLRSGKQVKGHTHPQGMESEWCASRSFRVQYTADMETEEDEVGHDSCVAQGGTLSPKVNHPQSACPGARPKEKIDINRDINLNKVLEDEKQLQIEIKASFNIGTGNELKDKYEFKCGLREYMIWKYIMNSPAQCEKCNKHFSSNRENIVLQADSSVNILSLVNNREHVAVITKKVWDYAIDNLGSVLTIETVEVPKKDIGKAAEQFNKSFGNEIAYAAILEDCIYVVFPTSSRTIVKEFLRKCNDDKEKGISTQNVSVRKVLLEFPTVLEVCLHKEDVNIVQKIEEQEDTVVCTIEGPEKDVRFAVSKLKSMEESLKTKEVYFSTSITNGLQELFVEEVVNKRLKKIYPNSALKQTGCCLCLYGFDENELLKASSFVENLIVKRKQKLLESCSNSLDIIEHIKNRYKETVLVDFDHKTCQVYMMGLKDSVEKAQTEIVEVQEGRVSVQEAVKAPELPLEITEVYRVRNNVHFRYFEKSVFVTRVAGTSMVKVALCQRDYSIKVSGFEKDVKGALETIYKIEKAIVSEMLVFPMSKTVQYFANETSGVFLKKTEGDTNVLIEKQDIKVFGRNEIQVSKETHENGVIWSTSKKRSIYLEHLNLQKVVASIKIKPAASNPLKGHIVKGQYIVEMGLPVWKDGKHKEYEDLAEILTQVFNETSNEKRQTIAFSLAPSANWEFDDFVKIVVNVSVKWLLNSRNDTPHTVKLCVEDQQCISRTDAFVDQCVAFSLGVSQSVRELKTMVCKGQLDKMKADVLVNTAAWNLDLTKGYVSAALSRRAGTELQKECRKRYPNGIKYNEVAETSGYDADCEQIFHVTLLPYSDENVDGCRELFRNVMLLCLKGAARYDYKTIAFPAMGTGSLGYPVEVAASEMFGTVERFKAECPNTSLERVMFVIYDKDVQLLKYFNKIEREIVEQAGTPSMKQRGRSAVKLTITGTKENVNKAKIRVEEELAESNKPDTKHITGVSCAVFAAVHELHDIEMASLHDSGVDIEYDKNRDEILLTGDTDLIENAFKTLDGYLNSVKKMHSGEMQVKAIIVTSVEEVIRDLRYSRNGVCYIFDKNSGTVTIFADSKKLLNDSLEELQRTLRDTDDSAFSLAESTRIVEEMETEEFEERFSSKTVKPTVQRTFSWSKDSKHLRVYQQKDIFVKVYQANIIEVPVDGIVNAANEDLQHCGGIAHAIAKAAGIALIRESEALTQENKGPFDVTSVVLTSAGCLHYKYILHAVGPRWSYYKPVTKSSLKQCGKDLKHTVMKCLQLADEKNLTSLALPTISSGIFKVPKDLCAIQYAKAVLEFKRRNRLKEIHFVDIDPAMIDIMHKTFDAKLIHKKKPAFNMGLYLDHSTASNSSRHLLDDHSRNDKANAVNEPDHLSTRVISELNNTNMHASFISDGKNLKCSFDTKPVVDLYAGDIVNLSGIQAVVCSEDRTGQARGRIARLLLQRGGDVYRKAKSTHFASRRNDGEVIVTSAGGNSFECVMHVVVPKDTDTIAIEYRNILEVAHNRQLISLALPLLGTGTGRIDVGKSAAELFDALLQFYHNNRGSTLQVHIVLNDYTVFDAVQDIFKRRINDMKLTKTNKTENEDPHVDTETTKTSTEEDHTAQDADSSTTDEDCVICMDNITDGVKLKCGHMFCRDCIDGYFKVKKVCPTCGQLCGIITGDQPDGTMEILKRQIRLSGFDRHISLSITYNFHGGIQGPDHPRPGTHYKGITRTAYLPDSKEGREICAMLKVAFERRLVFTIGTSRTTGEEGVITWNDIHHKTDPRPNAQFGYPDDTYLQRVREEMEVKGVTLEDVDKKFLKQLEKSSFRQTIHVNV